jgi:hypothetical protein
MNEDVKKRQEKLEAFEKKLFEKRDIYSERILNLVPKLESLQLISDMQIEIHNLRHEIFEDLIKSKLRIVKFESELRERKINRVKQLRQLDQYKYDYKEVENIVETELSLNYQQLGIFKIYVDYLSGCITEIDKLGYSIKTKISIEYGK